MSSSHLIVGWVEPTSGTIVHHAFMAARGAAVELATLPTTNESEALAVNARGMIVGYALNTLTGPIRAVTWQNGNVSEIVLPLGPHSVAQGISDTGIICGWMGQQPNQRGFLSQNGMTTVLQVPPGAVNESGAAASVNNGGDACGYYFILDPVSGQYRRRGCAWIDGEVIDLGTLPGFPEVDPHSINDAREIVGDALVENGGTGFLWRDGVMHDLNDLVPPGSPTLFGARGINNRGQITGEAEEASGRGVAYRLTPALPAHPGDTNCDARVDVNDLLAVIAHWNPQGPVGGEGADLNRDNRIDAADLAEVIMHWG
jgi:probable HAF family extracellular repeat protein